MRGSTNKSSTKLNIAEKNNLTQVICLRMGKTTEAKPHRVNLGHHSRESTIIKISNYK